MNYNVLSIGVSKYDDSDITPLKPCDLEAKKIFETLSAPVTGLAEKNGAYYLLSSDEQKSSTRSKIISELDRLSTLTPESHGIIVYFSGHGSEVDGENYLIAKDTAAGNIKETAISLRYLYNTLRSAKAKMKVLILDCCKPGFLIGKDSGFNEDFEKEIKDLQSQLGDENLIVIASCKAKQVSYLKDENSSVFTFYLLEGLKGGAAENGFVSLNKLYDYVVKKVRQWSIDNNKQQLPFISLEGTTIPELILSKPSINTQSEVANSEHHFFKVETVEFSYSETVEYEFSYDSELFPYPKGGGQFDYFNNGYKKRIYSEKDTKLGQEKAASLLEQKLTGMSARLLKVYPPESFKRNYQTVSFAGGNFNLQTFHAESSSQVQMTLLLKYDDSFVQAQSFFEKLHKWQRIRLMFKASMPFQSVISHMQEKGWVINKFNPNISVEIAYPPLGKDAKPATVSLSKTKDNYIIDFSMNTISAENGFDALIATASSIMPPLYAE